MNIIIIIVIIMNLYDNVQAFVLNKSMLFYVNILSYYFYIFLTKIRYQFEKKKKQNRVMAVWN